MWVESSRHHHQRLICTHYLPIQMFNVRAEWELIRRLSFSSFYAKRNGNSNNGDELICTLCMLNWLHFEHFRVLWSLCRLRHSRIFSTKLEIFIQIYVSMCSNALARLWIWWMTICCKITHNNFMFRAGRHSRRGGETFEPVRDVYFILKL